jgi:hypothetical protein
MNVSPSATTIHCWHSSQKIFDHDLLNNGAPLAPMVEWRFKKEARQSAVDCERQLQIQSQLSDAGASVQKILSYKQFENSGEYVVRAEFETIQRQLPTNWRQVNECLDGMISCFSALTEIHANDVYHGNPCMDNMIFQQVDHPETGLRSSKGYLRNFQNCGHINGDTVLSAKDVQIALSDFGGRLLLIAENSGYTKIRVLKMHLESQVNFADQEELDALENAPKLLNHLRALKTLLALTQKDYPFNHQPMWGPLDQEQVLNEYLELQKQNQTIKQMAKNQFMFPSSLSLKTYNPSKTLNNNTASNQLQEFKKRFCTTNTAGVAVLAAGALLTLSLIQSKQTGNK